jgi:hypothetical protein
MYGHTAARESGATQPLRRVIDSPATIEVPYSPILK